MSHFIEKCRCGVTLSQCRCPDPNKTVKISNELCTHGGDCYCVCHSLVSSRAFCEHCKGANEVAIAQKALEPKRYKAIYTVPNSDPFAAGNKVEVEGYYVKHITSTPNPINTPEGYKKFVDEHTKHYIVTNGFSDWNMPREMEIREIDITTLKEFKDE